MKSLKNMFKQLQKGNFAYVLNRLAHKVFPVPNPIFYWDTFVMLKGTFHSKKGKQVRARKNCNGEVVTANTQILQNLLEQFPHHPYNKQRIEEGDGICLVNVSKSDEETILGYSWMKFKTGEPFVTNGGMIVEYDETVAGWGYGFYVIPECRLSNVFLQLTQAMREKCIEHRALALYSETDIKNNRSIKSFGRMGKQVYEIVLMVSLFGMKVFFVKKMSGGYVIRFRYVPKTHAVVAIKDA